MKLSLKIKLMITFFCIITIPMGILGYVSYEMSSKSIQASVEQQLKEQTFGAANLIDDRVKSVKHTLEVASLNGDIVTALKNLNTENVNKAYTYINQVQYKNQDYIEALIVTDMTGKEVFNNQTQQPDIDLSDRDYIKEALKGKEAVSEVIVSRNTGNPGIFIAYPLKDGGNVIGTLVGSINFNTISNYVSNIKLGESGYGFMTDKNGLFVSHPDKDKVLKETAMMI